MEQPDVREVVLTGGNKLVVIHAPDTLYLRLRAFNGARWAFLTPPLRVSGEQVAALSQELTEDIHVPTLFEHPDMDGRLNLMLFRDKVHVHFDRRHLWGSASDLRAALFRQ